jgi:hypothetical protein
MSQIRLQKRHIKMQKNLLLSLHKLEDRDRDTKFKQLKDLLKDGTISL